MNQSVIVVGVTLIWRKAVAAIHIITMKLYWRHLNLADMKNRQTAKLKSPPNIPHIRYISQCFYICFATNVKLLTSVVTSHSLYLKSYSKIIEIPEPEIKEC